MAYLGEHVAYLGEHVAYLGEHVASLGENVAYLGVIRQGEVEGTYRLHGRLASR